MTTAALKTLSRSAQRMAAHCAVQAALQVVIDDAGVPGSAVLAGGQTVRVRYDETASRVARARQEMMYLAVVRFGLSLAQVGMVCGGVSKTAVKKAVAAVEARRDDAAYDRRLDEMELELMGAA